MIRNTNSNTNTNINPKLNATLTANNKYNMNIFCCYLTVIQIDAVSAVILPVWVDFTRLKGLPCAPGPAATTRRARGMLVTNG